METLGYIAFWGSLIAFIGTLISLSMTIRSVLSECVETLNEIRQRKWVLEDVDRAIDRIEPKLNLIHERLECAIDTRKSS